MYTDFILDISLINEIRITLFIELCLLSRFSRRTWCSPESSRTAT